MKSPSDPALLNMKTFFTQQELDGVLNKMNNGNEPTDEECLSPGSDTNPSEDNFELKELIENIYLQKNKADSLIIEKQKTEQEYRESFDNFDGKPDKSQDATQIIYEGPRNAARRNEKRMGSQNKAK